MVWDFGIIAIHILQFVLSTVSNMSVNGSWFPLARTQELREGASLEAIGLPEYGKIAAPKKLAFSTCAQQDLSVGLCVISKALGWFYKNHASCCPQTFP